MPRENKSFSKIKQTVTMTSTMGFSKQTESPKSPVLPSKPIQECNLENVVESKAPTVKDIVRLRYMRFRANDIESTIDFYTTIGMNVEFKSDQMPWINTNVVKKKNTTNQTQGKSKTVEIKEMVQTPKPKKKSIVGFSFKAPGSTSVDPNENIQIIFEKAETPGIVTVLDLTIINSPNQSLIVIINQLKIKVT